MSSLQVVVKGARVNLKKREREKQLVQFDCNLSVRMKSSSEFTGIDVRSQNKKWFQKSSVWIVISIVVLVLGIIILTTVLLFKKMTEKSRVFLHDNPS
jgi:lipopolysaccharide/colanic/teichoic acid biosynthesis glycosyltransferase